MPAAESIILCPICGKPVPQSTGGPSRKYCCKKCKHTANGRAQAERMRIAVDAARPMVPCPVCGTEFKKKYARKYCSATCKERSRRESPQRKEWESQYKETNRDNDRDRAREYMRARLANDSEFRERQRKNAERYRVENKEAYLLSQNKHNAKRRLHNAHVKDWKAYKSILAKKHDQHVKCFEVFKKTASLGWYARYCKAIGKPWINPRLSAATQYKIRYRIDIGFRLGEINRQTWRKEKLLARDDGTINFWQLLRERKTCPYCGTRITKENAVADHMDPIKLGGANGQHNLTICCRDCNQKKSGRKFTDWLEMLPPSRRRPAQLWYIRKHGHQPDHPSTGFHFVFA